MEAEPSANVTNNGFEHKLYKILWYSELTTQSQYLDIITHSQYLDIIALHEEGVRLAKYYAFEEACWLYAYMKDGTNYVGSTGRTLQEALKDNPYNLTTPKEA